MKLHHGHHCVYNIHYHMVFAVKYRRALLRPEIEHELAQLGIEIEERYEIVIECMGADRDHVHLVCSAHPKYSPGDIVRIYKSITARELFLRFPQLKKEMWRGQFWSDGYYVSTEGEQGSWEKLVRYVEQQGQTPEAVNLRLFPLPPRAE